MVGTSLSPDPYGPYPSYLCFPLKGLKGGLLEHSPPLGIDLDIGP
jgi:hypothetical protein